MSGTLLERLQQKVDAELEQYKSGLLSQGAQAVMDSAYELSVKSELAARVDCAFLDRRQLKGLLAQERPLQLKVKGSTEETVPLDYAALPATALLPAESAGQLTVQLELPDTLEAPVTRGQTVGKAQLLCGEAVQGEYPVCAAADAPRMEFDTALQLLWDSLRGTAA